MKGLVCLILFGFEGAIAWASPSPIVISPPARCMSGPLEAVLKHVTDYSGYTQSSGATLTLAGIPILKMIKSQEVPRVSNQHDDSIVYIELRPMNFGADKKDLFPRFFIRCKLSQISASAARHECRSLNPQDLLDYGRPGNVPQAFGLSRFESSLRIEQGTNGCRPDQVSLNYQITLESLERDVAKIQEGAGLSALPLPEEKFFRSYYENFLQGWLPR